MHATTQQNGNDLGKIGKAFVEINNYLNNIYEPLQIINSTFDKSSFINISFNNPYAIQFNTTFSFQKEDIDFLYKDVAETDKQQLMEILNKNYGINDNTKYPIKIKYCELIELLKQIATNEKISGLCLEKYLILSSSKITEKKIHRGKISSTVSKVSFGVGLASVGTTLFGFVASVSLVGYVGFGIMIFFAGFSMVGRSVNMNNEIKKQSSANEIKNAASEMGNVRSITESKIGNSLRYKSEQQNKKENNKKDNQKKIDKNINQSNNSNIIGDQNKKPVVKNNNKQPVIPPEKTIDNGKDEDKFNDIIKNYVGNKKENSTKNGQQLVREIVKKTDDVKHIPDSVHNDESKNDVKIENKGQKKEDKKDTKQNGVKEADTNKNSKVLNLNNIDNEINNDANKSNDNKANVNENNNANNSNNRIEQVKNNNESVAEHQQINNNQISNLNTLQEENLNKSDM